MPLDLDYYRDIPCNGNLFRAYYIAYNYGLLKNKTDILGAIILKWLKDSLIKLEQKEQGVIFKKENTVIILNLKDGVEIIIFIVQVVTEYQKIKNLKDGVEIIIQKYLIGLKIF